MNVIIYIITKKLGFSPKLELVRQIQSLNDKEKANYY